MTELMYSLARPPVPGKPATRIYVSGYEYKLVAPYFPRPPLGATVKFIWNWASAAGRVAKNIAYGLLLGTQDPTQTSTLQAAANLLVTAWNQGTQVSVLGSHWTLQNVTCKDNSGASQNSTTSTVTPNANSGTGNVVPPQSAVVISWKINASYRGGKPRWYIPGLCTNRLVMGEDSQINAGDANTLATGFNTLLSYFNAGVVAGGGIQLGTISYQTGHAQRPTPLWRNFTHASVHERLDSQRRRSGKEMLFPVIP